MQLNNQLKKRSTMLTLQTLEKLFDVVFNFEHATGLNHQKS